MFNLFKKQPNYPAIVTEIHNEFSSAGDELLHEAEAIIKNCEVVDSEKTKRLLKIGFKNVPQVKHANEVERKKAESERLAALIMDYKVRYPFNRFITREKAMAICEKYDLVLGDITMFKGFVPEKNLKDIENFKLNQIDEIYLNVVDERDEIIGSIPKKDVVRTWINYLKSSSGFYITGSDGTRTQLEGWELPHYEAYKGRPFVRAVLSLGELQICAPLKDMEVPQSHRVLGREIKHIPDPVVLQPVNGGYLIVTAWGDEASDNDVVNPVSN